VVVVLVVVLVVLMSPWCVVSLWLICVVRCRLVLIRIGIRIGDF